MLCLGIENKVLLHIEYGRITITDGYLGMNRQVRTTIKRVMKVHLLQPPYSGASCSIFTCHVMYLRYCNNLAAASGWDFIWDASENEKQWEEN